MILMGNLFITRTPNYISRHYGYRTRLSMKNRHTWLFAHDYFGRIWFWYGLVSLPLSIAGMLLCRNGDFNTIGIVGEVFCIADVISMALSAVFTENALRKRFDQDGRYKLLIKS
jgi:hypothetical protein